MSVTDFHARWASVRRLRYLNADRCPTCGEKLVAGFGLAGGGFGPYAWCSGCAFFAKKRITHE